MDKKQKHFFYFTKETIQNKVTLKGAGLFGEDEVWEFDKIWDFDGDFHSLDTLMVQPQYWNDRFIEYIKEKRIKALFLTDKLIGAFYGAEIDKFNTLTNINFLNNITNLKCLSIDALSPLFSENPIIAIKDYTPIENLNELEYMHIPDSGDFPIIVDINFSKLHMLKEVNLQYPKENKTIYECKNIERIDARYYEKNLDAIKNWKKLQYFSAYCDNLESFNGLENQNQLDIFRPEVTSKFKTFEDTKSKSIKTFYVYTEAKKTPKTLKGISGLEIVENIAINGFKHLEYIDDLYQCVSLKELTFENCKIPSDILKLGSLANLETLVFDDCKDIESLEFISKLPNLKYLSFDGNTKVIDGNLNFLKELSDTGAEIYFTDRKHYSIKCKDLNS